MAAYAARMLDPVPFHDPAFWAGDPYPTFAELRAHDPVHRYEGAAGTFWAVTHHADVQAVSGVRRPADPRPRGTRPSGDPAQSCRSPAVVTLFWRRWSDNAAGVAVALLGCRSNAAETRRGEETGRHRPLAPRRSAAVRLAGRHAASLAPKRRR